jgi:hypothetical protein
MPIPSAMATSLGGPNIQVYRWLEIEGLPYAYGNVAKDATWFAARAAENQLLGIKDWLTSVPEGVSADLDTKEGVASTVGQQDFSILDYDGSLTKFAAVGATQLMDYLANDQIATDDTFIYTGADANITNAAPGKYLYLGTETVQYGSVTTGTKSINAIVRGLFNSKAQAFGAGFPISAQPYTMAKRRAWYYVLAFDPVNGTPLDANKALIMSGTVEDFKLDEADLNIFVVTVESFERQINQDCFNTLRTLRDTNNQGICDSTNVGSGLKSYFSGAPVSDILFATSDLNSYTPGENFYVRVDDEIIGFKRDDVDPVFAMISRGCFNTEVVAHDPGWSGKEVAGVVANAGTNLYDTSVDETRRSWFISAPTTDSPLLADHPLMILLQVMLSTGYGTNKVIGKRNYDVLPRGWGSASTWTAWTCSASSRRRYSLRNYASAELSMPTSASPTWPAICSRRWVTSASRRSATCGRSATWLRPCPTRRCAASTRTTSSVVPRRCGRPTCKAASSRSSISSTRT